MRPSIMANWSRFVFIMSLIVGALTRSQSQVGSGSDLPFGSSGVDGSDDDDQTADVGSADLPSNCPTQREIAIQQRLDFKPRCGSDGSYYPMQCHRGSGECWCVNKLGVEIRGTIRRYPDSPHCGPGGYVASTRPTTTSPDDGIDFLPSSTTDSSADISDLSRSDYDSTQPATLMNHPAILATIIAVGTAGLIAMILLLACIVCRIRKKDEGSYALDERRGSKSSIIYTKTPHNQEFFA